MENNSPTPNDRLIRIREATQKTGLSKSTLYDLMAAGRFPQLVRLSSRRVCLIESEVDAWIASRIAERNSQPAA
ncbi:hypothetical protein C5B76_10935 [Aeromonas salmonicida]|uniref:helix-turn-helix transcriptional regulator n=1 Tax=Aeromonas salmonicida TaxID=645 RepID=UPI000F7B85A4|nr:AlpA family transcriptional regulator [Aeromonas salmonicida]RSM26076.1 hypothetical protein C5B76_10935 [Aeromonas salmonicida]